MNHRPRTAVSPLILLCAAAATLLAASVPASAQIPASARSAADAAAAAQYKPQIDAFIKAQVERLNDTKTPRAVHEARIQLESQAPGNASASYLQVYSASLNTNILPLASSKELMTRLNAAIVVAHIAERARNTELAPAAAKFMNDSQDPVALWGVKAAKQIIPIILNANGAQDPLSSNLLNVVKKNWFNGAIAYEAYDAYRLNTAAAAAPAGPAVPGAAPPANPAAIKAAVSGMLGLMSFRAELYQKGVPPLPSAESVAFNFLGQQRVWQQMSAAQQTQLMQLLVNFCSAGGQHCAVLDAEPRSAVAGMIAAEGSALQVIGGPGLANDPATADAGKSLRSFGNATPGDVILNATTKAVDGIVASAKWKGQLKAAAPIGDAAGKLLSNEPLEDDVAPATTAGGSGAGGGTTAPKGTGAAGAGNGGGASGATGGGTGTGTTGAPQ